MTHWNGFLMRFGTFLLDRTTNAPLSSGSGVEGATDESEPSCTWPALPASSAAADVVLVSVTISVIFVVSVTISHTVCLWIVSLRRLTTSSSCS